MYSTTPFVEKKQSLFFPESVLYGGDLTVQCICGLGGVLELPLQFPSVGVGSLSFLLSLLELALQLLHARVQLVDLIKTQMRAEKCTTINNPSPGRRLR